MKALSSIGLALASWVIFAVVIFVLVSLPKPPYCPPSPGVVGMFAPCMVTP